MRMHVRSACTCSLCCCVQCSAGTWARPPRVPPPCAAGRMLPARAHEYASMHACMHAWDGIRWHLGIARRAWTRRQPSYAHGQAMDTHAHACTRMDTQRHAASHRTRMDTHGHAW
eukprot:121768-Chlamydomonas_euryale.AAC.2